MAKTETMTKEWKQVKKRFTEHFPQWVRLAKECKDAVSFKDKLREQLLALPLDEGREAARNRLLRLLDYEGRSVDELSTGERLPIRTISLLWAFLIGAAPEEGPPDLYIDLFHLFSLLEREEAPPGEMQVRRQMARWPSGLDAKVCAVRAANKERLLPLLVQKIERRSSPHAKYHFAPGLEPAEKLAQVRAWWDDSRFQLAMAVKSPTELNAFLGGTLSEDTMKRLLRARKKQIPFFVTPYYLSLLDAGSGVYDDEAIRSYIIYSDELVEAFGHIKAWEREDLVEEGKPNAAGWLLPAGHNIHRRYPDVAILIPDSMGRACGGLCASCQRMYDFQSGRLNFDFEALQAKEQWPHKLRRLMQYFEDDTQLRDILITGGDALMSRDATLRHILEAVCKMALRKKKANESRPEGQKYAEIQRVRLGTRLPVYLPMRLKGELLDVLREFKEKAAEAGISQCYVQTHFQSPLELTPESLEAIRAIRAAGWTLTNQMVFTAAASRRGHAAKLRRCLQEAGVVCYYTFTVKGFRENYAMFAPNARSMQEAKEEKPFVQGTDRNVLNLPGIGKSMSFTTVGLTADGRRILKFAHDRSRRHSPIIEKMGEVYIVENKSIAAYLRQMEAMGEQPARYQTIWQYAEGLTEPRHPLYQYPPFPFTATEEVTHFAAL
ncbi:MAG: KamA family protein [Tannerella sp.]|jgi:lysine 2,3-aminomutase|nr:KamA family protein [Tannerella sp.]